MKVKCPARKTVRACGVKKNIVNSAKMPFQTSKKIVIQQVKYLKQIPRMIKSLLSMNMIKILSIAHKR